MGAHGVGTPGGARLRALREGLGKAQLRVEAEADLGTGYLQRVESGRVVQPGRATLERILDALGARYSERREVLALFGYLVATPLPDAAEIAWAREVCRGELRDAAFPAYTIDCATRLIAWNASFPRLLGVGPGDSLLARLSRELLLVSWFDPGSPLARLVIEPESFLPALIRALRYELRQLHAEDWYAPWMARLQELPLFRHYWAQVDREPEPASAARSLVTVRLAVPRVGPLQFRLAAEAFTRDARFRLVYLLPADADTLRQCAAWADEAP